MRHRLCRFHQQRHGRPQLDRRHTLRHRRLISSSIEANLGGVFTGTVGEAFVGGFDLIDEMNLLNQVNGLYTIAR
jgi:hypothetical protein